MKITNWRFLIKIIATVVFSITLIVLATIIYLNGLRPLAVDEYFRDVAYEIRGSKYGFWYWFFRIMTEFGNVYIIFLIVLATVILTKCDYRAVLLIVGILLSFVISTGMKGLYMRERPFENMRWMSEDSTSFPSSHSAAAGFLYSFLFYLIFHTSIKKKWKTVLCVCCTLIIFIVMGSRLILGVHYFSDCLAGLSIGIMVSCLMMQLYKICIKYDFMTVGLFEKIKENRKSQ